MYQLLRPKFRFGLFVVDNSKSHFYKNPNPQNSHLPVICHADTYEINGDGSIVFYQTIKTDDDKKFKVPVLSYPNGKWDACVLLDDTNDFPVFKGYSVHHQAVQHQSISTEENQEDNYSQHSYQKPQTPDSLDDELNSLSDNFSQSIQDKTYSASNIQTQQHHTMPFHHGQTTGSGMPGISASNNPQEFKKQKEEWIENEIKNFIKEVELFSVSEFLPSIQKKPQNKTYKTSETDIVWAASKLIRNKTVMSRKFAETNIQKTLSLILPDIMKRQWDGKMAPILQILQEKEETKNITAIDLAVWMVQNNY